MSEKESSKSHNEIQNAVIDGLKQDLESSKSHNEIQKASSSSMYAPFILFQIS